MVNTTGIAKCEIGASLNFPYFLYENFCIHYPEVSDARVGFTPSSLQFNSWGLQVRFMVKVTPEPPTMNNLDG
jgi:hypothetical protein